MKNKKPHLSNIILIVSCALIFCIISAGAFLVVREINEVETVYSEWDETVETDRQSDSKPKETRAVETTTQTVTTITETQPVVTLPIEPSDPTSIYGADKEKIMIHIYSYSDEIGEIADLYLETYPERAANVEFKTTAINNKDGLYQPALDQLLMNDATDIYCVERRFLTEYAKGGMSEYAATYEDLGIDAETLAEDAKIAEYAVELGRNTNGDIIGLGYENTAGAFIYRRSMAIETWGTDDPDEIAEKIKDWDSFLEAGADLAGKGYKIASSYDDVWIPYSFGTDSGWTNGSEFEVSYTREGFLDYAKILVENGYVGTDEQWSDEWYNGINGTDPVFGYFGPAWYVSYLLRNNSGGTKAGEGTYGDWAVCEPTEEFFIDGTLIMAGRNVLQDPVRTQAVADFIKWVTLDTSRTSLQQRLAEGNMSDETWEVNAPMSGVIMERTFGELEIIGGQDMFEIYRKVGGADTQFYRDLDYDIDTYWLDAVYGYVTGVNPRERVFEEFMAEVEGNMKLKYKIRESN
jgi:hypothetical protein